MAANNNQQNVAAMKNLTQQLQALGRGMFGVSNVKAFQAFNATNNLSANIVHLNKSILDLTKAIQSGNFGSGGAGGAGSPTPASPPPANKSKSKTDETDDILKGKLKRSQYGFPDPRSLFNLEIDLIKKLMSVRLPMSKRSRSGRWGWFDRFDDQDTWQPKSTGSGAKPAGSGSGSGSGSAALVDIYDLIKVNHTDVMDVLNKIEVNTAKTAGNSGSGGGLLGGLLGGVLSGVISGLLNNSGKIAAMAAVAAVYQMLPEAVKRPLRQAAGGLWDLVSDPKGALEADPNAKVRIPLAIGKHMGRKAAVRAAERATTKRMVAEAAERAVLAGGGHAAISVAEQMTTEALIREAGAKGVARMIPVLGSVASAGFAGYDYYQGNIEGAMLNTTAGLLELGALIPIVGPGFETAAKTAEVAAIAQEIHWAMEQSKNAAKHPKRRKRPKEDIFSKRGIDTTPGHLEIPIPLVPVYKEGQSMSMAPPASGSFADFIAKSSPGLTGGVSVANIDNSVNKGAVTSLSNVGQAGGTRSHSNIDAENFSRYPFSLRYSQEGIS